MKAQFRWSENPHPPRIECAHRDNNVNIATLWSLTHTNIARYTFVRRYAPAVVHRLCRADRSTMSLAALGAYKHLRNHQKWGFITDRCYYCYHAAWARFINRWSERVNEWLIRQNERQLIENFEWTIREDRAYLNSATAEDVRKLFTVWTETEEALAEQRTAIYHNVMRSLRYDFCVHVDAEALDECLCYDALPGATQTLFWGKRRDPALGRALDVNFVQEVKDVIILNRTMLMRKTIARKKMRRF